MAWRSGEAQMQMGRGRTSGEGGLGHAAALALVLARWYAQRRGRGRCRVVRGSRGGGSEASRSRQPTAGGMRRQAGHGASRAAGQGSRAAGRGLAAGTRGRVGGFRCVMRGQVACGLNFMGVIETLWPSPREGICERRAGGPAQPARQAPVT